MQESQQVVAHPARTTHLFRRALQVLSHSEGACSKVEVVGYERALGRQGGGLFSSSGLARGHRPAAIERSPKQEQNAERKKRQRGRRYDAAPKPRLPAPPVKAHVAGDAKAPCRPRVLDGRLSSRSKP